MYMIKSSLVPALILKRTNTGEMDRVVTILTPDFGKMTVIAKGCRKMSSSQRSHLEPGNIIDAYLIYTKSLPILTQSRLINNLSNIKTHLQGMKKLFQVLEIIDTLFVENEGEQEYLDVISLLTELNQYPNAYTIVQDRLNRLMMKLGYQDSKETEYKSIIEYVSSVAERPMKSYSYLTIKSQ